ncbi:hypothetical protein T492DRAFT_885936 [Pavlovales sp. CCMP2436]|nr:hypothetical protein T492DRAFT_885936 [Pavlovales sp. CCMP2436]
MGVVRKIDALAGAGKLRALCAELSALPVEQWRVKQMKALLLQSGELASADGITEKDQLRELVRKVLGTHKPADGAWYAPSTPAAARPAAPAAINSTQPPPPPVTTAAPSSEGAKPVDRAGAAAGAGGGAGKSKRKKKRGGKPRPAADKSDSSDTGKMDTGATGSRKAGSGNADTGIADGGKVVSGKAASGKVDTGIADSGEVESGTANSGKVDTGKLDTGTVDSGEGATANELAAALRLQAAVPTTRKTPPALE